MKFEKLQIMQDFLDTHNLIFRIIASILIILHLFTFGPIKDALAFSSSSINYKLTSGVLNEGGRERGGGYYSKLLLHADGLDGSTTFKDETGKTVTNSGAYDSYTKLMLHADGTDGSTTFTDEIGKTVTANGNAQIDTAQSKFGGASGLFDGTGDYLSLADSDDWNFGSGDFTIDFWVKFNSVIEIQDFFAQENVATDQLRFEWTGANNTWRFQSQTPVEFILDWPDTLSINVWYHIAFVRNGNNFYVFRDGVSLGIQTNSNSIGDYTSNLFIGRYAGGAIEYFNGWLDELRISKGIAPWTSNFTPPPSDYGKVVTSTAQSKFGGASGYFDGSGSYLSLADSDDWNFGSGDFTIDFWVMFNSITSSQTFVNSWNDNVSNGWAISWRTSNNLHFRYSTTGTDQIDMNLPWTPSTKTWYHIAIVKSGSNLYAFVDGTQIGTTYNIGSTTIYNSTDSLYIGIRHSSNGPTYDLDFNGWLDEIRISKGIARWTANFTPPTQPYSLTSDAILTSTKLWQDELGEPCVGKAQSTNYLLYAGFIPTIQSNPPTLTQDIPYQTWLIDTAKTNAFDLDDYFSSPEGYALNYSVMGNSAISISIDPATHTVSFSQAQAWFGVENVYFTATDTEGNTTQSNEVILQVENLSGLPDQPAITEAKLIPSIIKEGDLITLTVKALDLDNDDLSFTYSLFFTETKKYKEGNLWVSEATWQTAANSKGHYNITITVTDTTNLTDTKTITVNVGNFNSAPVLNPISDITANESELVVVTPSATDVDNDAITFYYSPPLDSSGKWLTDYDDAGTHTATVIVSDGIDTVSQSVNIIINNTNRAPQVSLTLSKYTVSPNEVFTIYLSATDLDGDSMTFSLKADSSEIASGSITSTYTTTTSFSSIGDHTISATVTDAGIPASLSATDTKGVDVADPNADRDYINPVMGDFNGDALSDLGLHDSQTGKWEIAISDKGVFRNAVDWLTGFGTSKDWWPMGGDFNGDAKTDAAIYNNTNGQLQVATSSGSSFSSQGTWLTFSSASYSWQPFTGNFNGDKYTDFAVYNKDSGEVQVALGTGTGFGSFNTWITGFGNGYVAMGGDFNADSLTDLCLFYKSSGEFKIAFSNTKSFVDGTTWISGYATNQDPLLSDFNNDGLTDIGYWDKSSTWYYAISTGATFIDKGVWLSSFGSSSEESASTGDFEGNGVTDAATFDKDSIGITRWRVRLSTDKPTDLLTEIDNGIGGKTQVVYTYSSDFTGNEGLPFPVYVAKSISLLDTLPSDQLQETYTQNFSYSGGYYDATEREFRGFATVKVTDPITNNYSETYFFQGKPGQDGALKGQIDKIISYDGNARKISETLNTYEVRKSGSSSDKALGFPALTKQTTTIWEENAKYITTQDEFTYDNIGNLLEAKQAGITSTNITGLSTTGDERATSTTYAPAYEIGFNRPLQSLLKDKDANIVSEKDFAYDTKGNLSQESIWIYNPLTLSSETSTTAYTYDSFGNLSSTTNALGSVVTTDYETTFYTYPEKITNSLGHTITYIYEPKFGVVKSVTDANGATSTSTYDTLGRVTQVTNALNQIPTTFSYPDFNTKVTTNALGLTTTEYIDGIGRRYKTVSSGEDGSLARQVVSETFYDNRGLTDKESLPHYIDEASTQVSYIRYEYDIRGRIKKTISDFPGTSKDAEASISYIDPLYVETTDPQGHKKGTKKDIYGNIIEVIEFAGNDGVFHTYYEYDIQNNLIKTTDNLGNITQIYYDSLGRKLKMIDPDMGTWTYEYDLVGNLIKQTDAKGQVLEFTYDALNRLTEKQGLSPTGTVPVILATYIYDDTSKSYSIGRLSKVTDLSGQTEFFYDILGREIKSVKGLSPQGTVPEQQFTVERTYDTIDRLTKLTYPDGEVVSYTYDTNSGLLEKAEGLTTTGTVSYVKDIIYNAQGQIKTIQYGNGAQTDYTYGQDLRLSRIYTQGLSPQGTVPVQDLNYIFDKNGNITTLTDNLKSNIRDFKYDDLDRLTDALNVPEPSGGYGNFYYKYDSIGNMSEKTEPGKSTIYMTYGEGLTPQGTVPKPHALTSAGGYTYSYDANGNMTSGKNKTLKYDTENRLIEVDELGIITSFIYDGDGGRVKKGLSPQGTVPEQWTTYIGSLFEKDSDGTIRKHIFAGANRICTQGLSPQGTVPVLSYYHSDHLGSSNVVTDSSGNQVASYEYTPYGTPINQGTDVIKHKFTGKELDNTGLYFYGARYYDPVIGRFITADTIVQAPYDPQSLNRYAYARNNPLKYVDPSGHFWWFIPIIIGAIVGGAMAAITGGNIGLGILTGALGGAFFAGAAGIVTAMQLQGLAAAGVFAGAGAISGTASAAITGGNIGIGALTGAIGGALGYGASLIGGPFGVLAGIGAGAVAGGIGSVLLGGEFGEGAWQGAAAAGISYVASATARYVGKKTEAAKQSQERKIAQLQAVLDEGYAEGGAEGLLKPLDKIAIDANPDGLNGGMLQGEITPLPIWQDPIVIGALTVATAVTVGPVAISWTLANAVPWLVPINMLLSPITGVRMPVGSGTAIERFVQRSAPIIEKIITDSHKKGWPF